LRELSRIVHLEPSLVDYHLLYLEKRDLIYSVQDGQFKRYHPKDAIGPDKRRDIFGTHDKPLIGLLRQPLPFRIVILILRSGTMSHKELANLVRRSPSTVSHHLDKLIRAEVVTRNPNGVGFCLSDPARIEKILLSFVPQPALLTDGFLEIWDDLYL
jgi:DNA-binding MarR family transcriptional regulator